MTERDPDHLADELEREADKLEEHNDELEEKVHDVRQDWERKRADQSVPGPAPPDSDDAESAGSEDDEDSG
jgi:hypothetical protein